MAFPLQYKQNYARPVLNNFKIIIVFMNKNLLRIAFADDDTDDHLFFFDAIKSIYHLALINNFLNSEDLLNFFTKEKHITPHIIFLDKNMPGNMNYECLVQIKETKSLASVPVIIYSTTNSQDEINEAMLKGATGFIIKPPTFAETVQVLHFTISNNVEMKFHEKPWKQLYSVNGNMS